MKQGGPTLQGLFRNLSLLATVFFGACMVLGGQENTAFLAAWSGPAAVGAALLWGMWYEARAWRDHALANQPLVTAQGPGGEVLQKATLASFRRQEGVVEGSEADDCFVRAERHFAGSRYAKAATAYQEAIRVQPTVPAYLNLGLSLLNSSAFSEAGEVIRLGSQLARRQQSREFQAAFLANTGALCVRQANLDAALESCEGALQLFRQLGDERGHADVLLTMANIHAHWRQWSEVEQDCEAALRIHGRIGSDLGRANVLGTLGNMHADRGDSEAALKHFHAALAVHEDIGNSLGRANVLTNIGNAHFREARLEDALTSYAAALDLHRELADPLGEATVLGNMGNVHFKEGRPDEALEVYDEALTMHRQIGNLLGQANVLTNIGSVLTRQRQGKEALEVLEQARTIYQDVGARTKGLEAVEQLIERLRRRAERKRKPPPGAG